MKGIHKNIKPTIGNVEFQRAAFQTADSKKLSLKRAAEESLKFQKLVEDSKTKMVLGREEGGRKQGEGKQDPSEDTGHSLKGNPVMDKKEDLPSSGIDIRI